MGIVTKFNPLGTLPKINKVPEEIFYTLTINTTPANAKVTMNGEVAKTLTFKEGTMVQYVVSADHYLSHTSTITMTEDKILNIGLVAETYTVTIKPSPSDAVVTINGIAQKTITAAYGTSFSWSVSAPYYVAQSGTETITKTYTKNITLAEKSENIPITKDAGLIVYGTNSSWSSINSSVISFRITTANKTSSQEQVRVGGGNGIVTGPCKVKITCNTPPLQYPIPTGWVPNICYTLGSPSSTVKHLEGTSGVITLEANQKLSTIGVRYKGGSIKHGSTYNIDVSFTCKKLLE